MSVEAELQPPICPCETGAECPGFPSGAQKFFAAYAAEIRGPNYGDHARDFVRTMLARAELAGIYVPEAP